MAAPFDPGCIFATCARHDVDYVLIGGLAAVIRGSTAMTNDADLVPRSTPENLGRVAEVLRDLDARLRVPDTPDGVMFDPHPALLASMTTLNTTTRCGDVDFAFAPAGLDDYDALVAASDVYDLDGVHVQVAALDDIIRSKEAAGRAKDHATLPILRALREEIERQN